MSRIRTIKPDFFSSEQVADCSPTARLLFIGMWCFCDDAGIHPASLKSIKMQVFPADNISVAEISQMINELKTANLLIEYSKNNKQYWQVTGWHHQKIERPTYRHPLPDNSPTTRRMVNETSATEWKGKERKGEDAYQEEDLSIGHSRTHQKVVQTEEEYNPFSMSAANA